MKEKLACCIKIENKKVLLMPWMKMDKQNMTKIHLNILDTKTPL